MFLLQPNGLEDSSRWSPTTGSEQETISHSKGVPAKGQILMGSTFFSLYYHVVFSTKERRPIIETEWRPRLHSYIGGIVRGMNGVAEIVGGVEDHIHLLISLRPVHCLASLMRDLKKDSTNWVKENRSKVLLAGRICRVYRKPLCGQSGKTIHRKPGSTSFQTLFR